MPRSFPSVDDANLLFGDDIMTALRGALAPAPAIELPSRAPFSRWAAARRRLDTGTGHAKLLVVGDSKSWGYPDGMDLSWPALIGPRALGGRRLQPGASIPGVKSVPDLRWAVGTFDTVFGPGSGALYGEPGNGAPATFTPGVIVDTVDVWWFRGIGKGKVTVSIDGAPQAPIDTNSTDGSGGWRKTSYTVTANAGHVLSFARPTDGAVHLFIDAYQDSVKSVRTANWGVIGSTTDTWANGPYSTDAITGWSPDLTLVMLGTNDATNGAPAATWRANIERVIDAAKVTGDVVLVSCAPSRAGTTLAGETAYRAVGSSIAAAKDIAFLDVFSKLGSYDATLFADDVHPNTRGHAAVARIVAAGLRDL